MREETVYESDLIREKQTESEAQHTRRRPEMAMKKVETSSVGDGHRDCRRQQHHASDGAKTEDNEVSEGPDWSLNDWQDEKRDCSRASESMHDADDDRPNRAIPFDATKDAIQARGRHGFFAVAMHS